MCLKFAMFSVLSRMDPVLLWHAMTRGETAVDLPVDYLSLNAGRKPAVLFSMNVKKFDSSELAFASP
jgi:hypothetical protein